MRNFRQHSQRKETRHKATGKVVYAEFDQKPSKPIVDQIDRVLVEHYGFTAEELYFIINYDIKYRRGKSGSEDSGASSLAAQGGRIRLLPACV